MSIGAWVMLIIGCVILYGGLSRSFYVAHKHAKKYGLDEDEPDIGPTL